MTITRKQDPERWLAAEEDLISLGVWAAPKIRAAKPKCTCVGTWIEKVIQRAPAAPADRWHKPRSTCCGSPTT